MLRGHNVTGTQCYEEETQCYEEGTQCYEEGTLRYGDIMLRGHNVPRWGRNVTGTFCTGWYLYGLGINRNNEGTLCDTLGKKCNGDIMNGDTKIIGWGHNVTGVATQCFGGHNERGHNVTRPKGKLTRSKSKQSSAYRMAICKLTATSA